MLCSAYAATQLLLCGTSETAVKSAGFISDAMILSRFVTAHLVFNAVQSVCAIIMSEQITPDLDRPQG